MRPLNVFSLSTGLILAVPLLTAQSEYSTGGQPSALEEEIRWLANRARHDTASENGGRGTAYTDVAASSGPLAPHESLVRAARRHSEDMARNNVFQHDTVAGSAHYDPVTQPKPWDRMRAEGYAWTRAGENIAAGYSGAAAAYLGWWNSTGHRRNLCNPELREIGNGYYYWQNSQYRRYYTMKLGAAGSAHFFTGTLFRDTNGNGAYTENEGVAGIRVSLRVNGVSHSHYAVSCPAGSFAVPIQSIPGGATVEAWLANHTAATVSLSIPRDYHTFDTLALAPGEEQAVGSWVKPSGTRNFGFRDLTPPFPELHLPTLHLTRTDTAIELRWASEPGRSYLPEVTVDLRTWMGLVAEPEPGTGSDLGWVDLIPVPSAGLRFYRVVVVSP